MENINVYNQRLAVFAAHLRGIELKKHPRRGQFEHIPLCNWVNGVVIHYEVRIHAWIFDSLPKLFPKVWIYNSRLNAPVLKGLDESENPIAGVFDFFGLNPEEFTHLFDVDGFQNLAEYGGAFILDTTEIQQIARNISELIRHRMSSGTRAN